MASIGHSVRSASLQLRAHASLRLLPYPLLLIAFFIGCVPRREKAVVIYSSADREYATPILDAFERANNGLEVVRQFDVEASKTLGLVTRIEQERDRPRCDVFWNNEIMHTIRLQKAGLLVSRRWPVPDSWPKSDKASDGTWIGFAARARVLLVNTDKLKDRTQWPSSVYELADPKWSSRCGMAFPIYGTTATHMTVLASNYNAIAEHATFIDWLRSVKKNTVVLAGNKQVAMAVSSGELDWGLTDTDDAMIEKESGKPVTVVFPDQAESEMGTLFIPNTIAVVKKGPNPVAAEQLANYLISDKVEGRLVMSSSAHFPIWPSNYDSLKIDEARTTRHAEVDFEKASMQWEQVSELLTKTFGPAGAEQK